MDKTSGNEDKPVYQIFLNEYNPYSCKYCNSKSFYYPSAGYEYYVLQCSQCKDFHSINQKDLDKVPRTNIYYPLRIVDDKNHRLYLYIKPYKDYICDCGNKNFIIRHYDNYVPGRWYTEQVLELICDKCKNIREIKKENFNNITDPYGKVIENKVIL